VQPTNEPIANRLIIIIENIFFIIQNV
jgi:hypothetical protein